MFQDYQQRLQAAIENLLGNASLTGQLDDDAAQVLIDWGIAWTRQVFIDTTNDDLVPQDQALEVRLRTLRRFMRQVNRWAPAFQDASREDNAFALQRLVTLVQEIFGPETPVPSPQEQAEFLEAQSAKNALELIQALKNFVHTNLLLP